MNLASQDLVREVDYFGLASGADEDKFASTGLTPGPAGTVDAPGIAEFPIVIECRLLHAADLGVHTQFVGEALEVQAHEAVLGPGGLPDVTRVRPLLYSPGQTVYCGIGPRLAQASSVGKGIGEVGSPPTG